MLYSSLAYSLHTNYSTQLMVVTDYAFWISCEYLLI